MDARYGRQFSVEKFEKNTPPLRYMEFTNIWVPVWLKEVTVSNEKKILKKNRQSIFALFPADRGAGNILSPLFCRKPDEKYVESLRETEFTSETEGTERICCIDDNEEALLWRLRMIGTAKESIVLSTFDLRADDNGTKILAALNCAAARGVKIQLLIDGIYQQLFLAGSSGFPGSGII